MKVRTIFLGALFFLSIAFFMSFYSFYRAFDLPQIESSDLILFRYSIVPYSISLILLVWGVVKYFSSLDSKAKSNS